MEIIIIAIMVLILNYILFEVKCIIVAKRAFERHNKKKIKFREMR
jgi:hypothetical protein